jgi:hypothetical protein
MRRLIVMCAAMVLACVAVADDGLVPFGELREDALIRTGAVEVAETDHIAIPMIEAPVAPGSYLTTAAFEGLDVTTPTTLSALRAQVQAILNALKGE